MCADLSSSLSLLVATPIAEAAEDAAGFVKPEEVAVLHGEKGVWLNEYSAGELQKYVEQMTGKKVPVARTEHDDAASTASVGQSHAEPMPYARSLLDIRFVTIVCG